MPAFKDLFGRMKIDSALRTDRNLLLAVDRIFPICQRFTLTQLLVLLLDVHSELLPLMGLLDLIPSPSSHVWDLFRRLWPKPSTSPALRKYMVLEDLSVSWLGTLQPWSPWLRRRCQVGKGLCAVLIVTS